MPERCLRPLHTSLRVSVGHDCLFSVKLLCYGFVVGSLTPWASGAAFFDFLFGFRLLAVGPFGPPIFPVSRAGALGARLLFVAGAVCQLQSPLSI